jgi:DMSO/TMAO reductase YedYZ molybdopterin-dependent catalytic subunit
MKNKQTTPILIATILGLLLLSPIGFALADTASTLEIVNLSGASYGFSYAQLLQMPKTTEYAELYCEGVLTAYGNWSGVLLSYLLTQAQVAPEVGSIQFAASDGYKVAIPISLAMQPQIIIAYAKDGQPLTEGLRLIIPGANGGSWIAMITSITMSTSGADYPPSVSVAVPKADNMPTQSSTTQTSPPKQQVTQPQSSAENSSSTQEVAPANVTSPYQPALNPQVTNQSLNLQTIIVGVIGVAGAISLTAAVYVALRRRKHKF